MEALIYFPTFHLLILHIVDGNILLYFTLPYDNKPNQTKLHWKPFFGTLCVR